VGSLGAEKPAIVDQHGGVIEDIAVPLHNRGCHQAREGPCQTAEQCYPVQPTVPNTGGRGGGQRQRREHEPRPQDRQAHLQDRTAPEAVGRPAGPLRGEEEGRAAVPGCGQTSRHASVQPEPPAPAAETTVPSPHLG